MTAKILFIVWKSSFVSFFFFPSVLLVDSSECSLLFLGTCYSLTVKKCLNLMINLVGLIDRVVIFSLPPNMLSVQ